MSYDDITEEWDLDTVELEEDDIDVQQFMDITEWIQAHEDRFDSTVNWFVVRQGMKDEELVKRIRLALDLGKPLTDAEFKAEVPEDADS